MSWRTRVGRWVSSCRSPRTDEEQNVRGELTELPFLQERPLAPLLGLHPVRIHASPTTTSPIGRAVVKPSFYVVAPRREKSTSPGVGTAVVGRSGR